MVGDRDSGGPDRLGQLVIYQDGATRLQVRIEGRSVWLSQRLIAELYQVSVPTVNEHLAGIYADGEVDPGATIRSFRIVQREGSRDVSRAVEHYSLDAKADVTVAKNYLTQDEIRELNRVVTMYLDFAEDQAQRKRPMHMANWAERLDAFLRFNERNVLTHAGTVSHELAEQSAHAEFEKHDDERRRLEAAQPTSDFDRAVEEVKRLEAGTRERKASVKKSVKTKPSRSRKPKGDEA